MGGGHVFWGREGEGGGGFAKEWTAGRRRNSAVGVCGRGRKKERRGEERRRAARARGPQLCACPETSGTAGASRALAKRCAARTERREWNGGAYVLRAGEEERRNGEMVEYPWGWTGAGSRPRTRPIVPSPTPRSKGSEGERESTPPPPPDGQQRASPSGSCKSPLS